MEMWKKKKYDLIIMNVNLPDNSDNDIAKTISADPKHSNIGIIGISSNPSEEEKEMCVQAGVKIYMKKPFTNELLYGNVIQLLDD